MKVLGMTVKGIGHQPAHGDGGVIIGANKVAHVDQHAKVGMIDGGHQLFHAQALLAEPTVVFDHRLDPFAGRVFGDSAATFGEAR